MTGTAVWGDRSVDRPSYAEAIKNSIAFITVLYDQRKVDHRRHSPVTDGLECVVCDLRKAARVIQTQSRSEAYQQREPGCRQQPANWSDNDRIIIVVPGLPPNL